MATLKYLQITNSGKGVEKREHIHIVGRNVNWCSHYEKQYVLRAQLLQSCPALCYPIDCSPPGSSVHGILQAKILEWAAMPSSGVLPDPGIKPTSFMSLELAGGFFTTSSTWEAWETVWSFLNKLKIELPYDLAIPLLDIYPNKIIIQKHT